MDVKELQSHLDKRLDSVEDKLDQIVPAVATHAEQIKALQGFAKYGIMIFITVAGFFAAAYFGK